MKKIYAISPMFSEEFRKLEERETEFLSVEASDWDFNDETEGDKPYQVLNGTALYAINGKMLPSSNFFTQVFGITTYEDIGNDFAAMAVDEEVNNILISMSTPGGAVAGISDLTESWKQLDAVKPITTHTAGMIASAGLWLASNSSGGIFASEVAEVGSIGVIMQHVSQEKMLNEMGIKVTEIKSAPLKAIGSPAKDLTEGEQAHLQMKVDEMAGLFKKQIYLSRPGVSEAAFTGEVFIASEAERLGLIDGVKTFSEVFTSAIGADGNDDSQEVLGMKKQVTAEMFEAAVAAGADPESLEIVSQEIYDALDLESTDTEVEAEVLEDEEPVVEAVEEEVESVDFEAKAIELAVELTEKDARIVELENELENLKASSDSDPLKAIALDRVSVMRVALGMQAMDMAEFPVASILAEYKALDKQFKKQFKTGGYLSENTADPVKPKAVVTNIDDARLRAVGV